MTNQPTDKKAEMKTEDKLSLAIKTLLEARNEIIELTDSDQKGNKVFYPKYIDTVLAKITSKGKPIPSPAEPAMGVEEINQSVIEILAVHDVIISTMTSARIPGWQKIDDAFLKLKQYAHSAPVSSDRESGAGIVSGSMLLHDLFQVAAIENEDGMPVIKYVDKPNGGSVAYVRHDAMVKKLNSLNNPLLTAEKQPTPMGEMSDEDIEKEATQIINYLQKKNGWRGFIEGATFYRNWLRSKTEGK